MEYRQFGSTDLHVSEIGFGAWAIGGGAMAGNTAIGWGDTDDAMAVRAINKSRDCGINFFDTADIYGYGHSEELIGKTIGNDQSVIVATKGGNTVRSNVFTIDYDISYLRFACEMSLRRLKRDAIDYYQLHSARISHLEDGKVITLMETLRKEGKIRYWGLSLNTFDPATDMQWMMEREFGDGFQLVLNLINHRAVQLIRQPAISTYGIIARMPLQFGLLTGKFDDGIAFAANDHRNKRLTPQVIQKSNEALARVWNLCQKYGCSKTQLALAFVLSFPQVSTVIPGIRTPEQATANTSGLFAMTPEDRDWILNDEDGQLKELMELVQSLG